jgi:signal peptidase I
MRQNVYDYAYELKRERNHRNTTIFTVVLSVFIFLTIFLHFILFPIKVNSQSMESDVVKGGALFVTPIVRTPSRGDVIYISRADNVSLSPIGRAADAVVKFFTAQHFSLASAGRITGKPCVRRVLAVPGDTIYMKDYVLYIKPAGEKQFLTEFELSSKSYNVHVYSVPADWDGLGSIGNMRERTLGHGQYFVLADNRIEAADSRIWGPINSSSIIGKVLVQYFPFSKIKTY